MIKTTQPTRIDRQPDLEQLRICVIASTYPRHEADYAVPWLRESVAHLADRGHHITVLAPSYEGLDSHIVDGVHVKQLSILAKTLGAADPRTRRTKSHSQSALSITSRTLRPTRLSCRAQLANREQFDIVHVHWPFPHEPIGMAAAKQCNAPLIMTSHGAEFALARRKPWVSVCLRRSLMKADELIANSSDTAGHVQQLCGRAPEVIPFGSTVTPQTAGDRPRRIGGPPRVLFTGRLIQRKGVEYLLHAAKQVVAQIGAKFIITGDGDQRSYLETLSRELGLQEHVEFLGFVSNEVLNEQYAQCDVWVNPSVVDDRGDTEGLGVGAIEAYAHGKPVIASDVGGIPDVVIDHQTGLLVPQKHPHALAKAISELLNDPVRSQRFAAAGLRHVQKRFNWSTITDQLESVYWRSLLNRDPIRLNATDLNAAGRNTPNAQKSRRHNTMRQMRVNMTCRPNRFEAPQSYFPHQVAATYRRRPGHVRQPPFNQRRSSDPDISGRGNRTGLYGSALAVCARQETISLNDIQWTSLVWAAVCYALFCVANAYGWSLILRALRHAIPSGQAISLWLRCEALRWLPGSVWNFGARSVEAHNRGVPQLMGAASMTLELFYSILGRFLIVVIACALTASELRAVVVQVPLQHIAISAIGIGVVMLTMIVIVQRRGRLGQASQRSQLRDVTRVLATSRHLVSKLFVLQGYYVVVSLLQGYALVHIVRGIHPYCPASTLTLIAINSAAWLVGFFAIFAPGGLVVREAFLATVLAAWCSPVESISIAVIWRMLQITVEASILVCVLAIRVRQTRNSANLPDVPSWHFESANQQQTRLPSFRLENGKTNDCKTNDW